MYYGEWNSTPVVLKLLKDQETHNAEFVKELRVLAKLRHPSTYITLSVVDLCTCPTDIVQLIGTYREAGKQYIVLEYLEKGDVSTLLKKSDNQLSVRDLLDIIFAAARGMEYLEALGILHNDLGMAFEYLN